MSNASSHYRLESPPLGLPRVLIGVLAVSAGIALLNSGLPIGLSLPLWLLALGYEFRRRRLVLEALVIADPDRVQLIGRDEPMRARLRRLRRMGPLLVLDLDDAPMPRLLLWLPTLPLNTRRAFLRALNRLRPAAV